MLTRGAHLIFIRYAPLYIARDSSASVSNKKYSVLCIGTVSP